MESDDRKLFEDSLRALTQSLPGQPLDAALDELGWRDAFAEEPHLAVSLLFELQGAANATSNALGEVVRSAALADGEPTTAVVLPSLGRHDPPGVLADTGLTLRGLATASALRDDDVLAVARAGDEHVAVRVSSDDLVVRPIDGMDPTLQLVHVTTTHATPVSRTESLAANWPAAVAAAHLALAHELVGASRAMLRLAREHAVERIQFGRPIAGFQAVRHRLSDSLVAVEAADATAAAAWAAPSPITATFAKAIAGRSARIVAGHAQQVLAGMGFTLEHPLHQYLRRTLVLDRLFGGARTLTAEIGADALRTRRVPDLVPL